MKRYLPRPQGSSTLDDDHGQWPQRTSELSQSTTFVVVVV